MDQEEKLDMQWDEKESPVAKSVTVAQADTSYTSSSK